MKCTYHLINEVSIFQFLCSSFYLLRGDKLVIHENDLEELEKNFLIRLISRAFKNSLLTVSWRDYLPETTSPCQASLYAISSLTEKVIAYLEQDKRSKQNRYFPYYGKQFLEFSVSLLILVNFLRKKIPEATHFRYTHSLFIAEELITSSIGENISFSPNKLGQFILKCLRPFHLVKANLFLIAYWIFSRIKAKSNLPPDQQYEYVLRCYSSSIRISDPSKQDFSLDFFYDNIESNSHRSLIINEKSEGPIGPLHPCLDILSPRELIGKISCFDFLKFYFWSNREFIRNFDLFQFSPLLGQKEETNAALYVLFFSKVMCEKIKFNKYIYYNNFFSALGCLRNEVLRQHQKKSIEYFYSVNISNTVAAEGNPFYYSDYAYVNCDTFVSGGILYKNTFKLHPHFIKTFVDCGNPWDGRIQKSLVQAKESPLITFFDSSTQGESLYGGVGDITSSVLHQFYECLTEVRRCFKNAQLVIKPKFPSDFERDSLPHVEASVIKEIKRIIEENQAIITRAPLFESLSKSSIVVAIPFTTPAFFGWSKGIPSIFYDPTEAFSDATFSMIPHIYAKTPRELCDLILFWLDNRDNESLIAATWSHFSSLAGHKGEGFRHFQNLIFASS